MKKFIFLLVVLVNISINNFGQSVKSVIKIPKLKIEILSGNPKYFKNDNSYHIQFDYSNLKVDEYSDEQTYIEYMKDDAEKRKKGSSDKWVEKWYSDRTNVFQPKFIELFNKFSGNKIKVDTVFKNQKYVLNLHTRFLAIGFNKNFTKSPTYINVIVTISELNSSEKPLIISMENIIGDEVFSSYSDDYRRIEESYAKCGKELAKYMCKVIY
jgi:hypothetical protein